MKADVADGPLKRTEDTHNKRLFILSHTFKLTRTGFIGECHIFQKKGRV